MGRLRLPVRRHGWYYGGEESQQYTDIASMSGMHIDLLVSPTQLAAIATGEHREESHFNFVGYHRNIRICHCRAVRNRDPESE